MAWYLGWSHGSWKPFQVEYELPSREMARREPQELEAFTPTYRYCRQSLMATGRLAFSALWG